MKVVIYVRVSSQEQVAGYSLDAQVELCRKYAAEMGYEIVRVFREPGQSARTDQRPNFQAAIKFVLAGGADAILVHKSDRFARNLRDYLSFRHILESSQKRILSVSETFLNDDSPESRLAAAIIGAVSEYVSDNIGRESLKGRNQKAMSGSWPGGLPPWGYERDNEKNIVVSKFGQDIALSFREFATGRYTLQEWAEQAERFGILGMKGQVVRSQNWQRVFRNVFYTGQFIWHGETVLGDHPALIDIETFNQVQKVLDERDSGGASQRHFWLLSGLLLSDEFKIPMQGSIAKGKYYYYRAKEHYVRADELEERVESLLFSCTGYSKTAPDYLHVALQAAPNLGVIYKHLGSNLMKRDYLRLIFINNGLLVSLGGAIVSTEFQLGFAKKAF